MKKELYPYLYIGHGVATARKAMEVYVCLKSVPSKEEKKWIQSLAPELMNDFFEWEGRMFTFGNASSLQWQVKDHYKNIKDPDALLEDDPELPSDAQWEGFNQDMDDFIAKVHQKYPVETVIKPIDEEYGTETDEWHHWSMAQFAEKALSLADEFKKIESGLRRVAWVWREEVEKKNADDQKKILKKLSREGKKWLKKWNYLPSAKEKPVYDPLPTLEEIEKLWPTLKDNSTGMRMEDYFSILFPKEKVGRQIYLIDYAEQWIEKKEYKKAIHLAEAILSEGAEFHDRWWNRLARIYLKTKDMAKAKEAIKNLIWNMEPYDPTTIMICMEYYQKLEDGETEKMLYHSGKRWFKYLSESINKNQAKEYGRAPNDLKDRFATWLRGWLEPEFEIKNNPRIKIGHWLVWFRSVGSSVFNDWIAELEKEKDARLAFGEELKKAEGKELKAFTEEIFEGSRLADNSLLFEIACRIQNNSPELSFSLYRFILEREGKNGYKSGIFYQSANNILGMAFHLDNDKEKEAALKLSIPWGHQNPAIFHNAACLAVQIKKYKDALFYVECAIKYGFDQVQTLTYTDPDLEPIRKNPEFEKMFKNIL